MTDIQLIGSEDVGEVSPFGDGVTHSHDAGDGAVHPITVTHACGEEQTFTVPDSHPADLRIVYACRRCGEHGESEGKQPHEVILTGVLPTINCGHCGASQQVTGSEFACTACGQSNRLIVAVDAGDGSASAATG